MAHQSSSSTASAHQELRRSILRARRLPGSRITEREVAAELGVSRTPVREALARLQREGLVVPIAERRRNLFEVAPLSLRELRQTSAATSALEGIGAAAAAVLAPQARVDLARQLESLLDSASDEMSSPTGSFGRALDLDELFHRTLVDGHLEPPLVGWLDAARTHVYRYVWMYSPKSRVSAARFRSEHAPMVTAVREGDAAALRAALEANWLAFATRIEPFLLEV
jgi:DNA-binding GntR family transcriptional regulator